MFFILLLVCRLAGYSINLTHKLLGITEGEALADTVGNTVYLEQGWTKKAQQLFYFTDEGSRFMPYSWFLALEQASSQQLFRSDANINAFRYLPTKPSKLNPDGLPIGFVKNVDSKGQEWVGFSCALCHTGQITYQGTNIRIDGGPTLGDIENFQISLVKALDATYEEKQKFARFAEKVLGFQPNSNDLAKLRGNLLGQTQKLKKFIKINYDYSDRTDYGFARVDAVGAIVNEVMATFNDLPENIRPADAPVSYPFLWGTHQSDVVQWPGFTPNGPWELGTLIRNAGQVLGTFGTIDIPKNKGLTGLLEKGLPAYNSSVKIDNLGKIETWVAELRSPRWPEKYLPAVNQEFAERGKVLYDQYCLRCHTVISRQDQALPYQAKLIPQKEVKTDPKELENLARKLKAGKYEGRLGMIPNLEQIPARTTALNPLLNATIGVLVKHPLATIKAAGLEMSNSVESIEEVTNLQGFFSKYQVLSKASQISSLKNAKKAAKRASYKARPLNGIWATAPYLHNGSVPNLYELLLSQKERSAVFYVGNREFDPVKVGYISNAKVSDISLFKFDTSLVGNSNQGHEYGVHLTDDQKWELIAYLKTL
ncbi:hypothetical protein Xen7305DRAFT_00012690 [Xenococcus sp. PCC 7305]|nr:hypothetical protein Xen7305DRAFT_00012690 [Xenococcus sp. PCC 7305]